MATTNPESPATEVPPEAQTTPLQPTAAVAAAPPASLPRWRSPAAAALLLTAAGVIVRLWILATTALAKVNGDQAVTGVMVRRILAGQNQYVFFAGQQYNGSLEQYLQAATYWIFRLPENGFTLRLTQVALSAASTWLMYLVGRRVLQRPWAAVLAAGLMAFGPFWTLYRGLGSFGAYPSLIVVGLVAVYCALRLGEGSRIAIICAAGFGFCVGIIAWLGLSGAELLIPAGLIAAPYFVRSWRLWVAAVPALLVGMAPILWWSVRNHSFALLNAGPPISPSTFGSRLHNLFGPVLREFVGVAYFNGDPGWQLPLQYLAVAVLAVAFAVAVIRHRRGILATVALRADGRSPMDALLLSIPLMALLYCSSKWAWFSAEPRYLFAFSPVLLWCLAAALPERPTRARLVTVLTGSAVFAGTSITMMLGTQQYVASVHGSGDFTAASAFLVSEGDTHGYADYWTAMPMLYYSKGTLNIAPLTGGRDKFPAVTAAADSAADTFYVAAGPDSEVRYGGRWMEKVLQSHHVTYRRTRFGALVVFDRLSPSVKPWTLRIGIAPR